MAEGGGEFGYEDPDLDSRVDHDDDDDEEQEVERTQPFQPGAASTPYQPGAPYHVGEQTEMRTLQHEQSGLPDTSYAETSFMGEDTPLLGDFIHTDDKPAMLERAKEKIRRWFPKVDFKKLGPIGFSKKANESEIVSFGPRGEGGGVSPKFSRLATKGYKKTFTDAKKAALGPRAEDIIAEDRDTIREMKQREKEAEIQLQQAETLASQREEEKKEVEVLRRKMEQTDAQIDAIQENQGSKLESEAELRRLKEVKRTIKAILKTREKNWTRLQKKQETEKKNKKRLTDSGPASQQKKVKQTPWKKGSTKQNRWTP